MRTARVHFRRQGRRRRLLAMAALGRKVRRRSVPGAFSSRAERSRRPAGGSGGRAARAGAGGRSRLSSVRTRARPRAPGREPAGAPRVAWSLLSAVVRGTRRRRRRASRRSPISGKEQASGSAAAGCSLRVLVRPRRRRSRRCEARYRVNTLLPPRPPAPAAWAGLDGLGSQPCSEPSRAHEYTWCLSPAHPFSGQFAAPRHCLLEGRGKRPHCTGRPWNGSLRPPALSPALSPALGQREPAEACLALAMLCSLRANCLLCRLFTLGSAFAGCYKSLLCLCGTKTRGNLAPGSRIPWCPLHCSGEELIPFWCCLIGLRLAPPGPPHLGPHC